MSGLPARREAEIPGAPPTWLKKKTMIKDLVGSVRTTCYDLPEERHVYGKADVKDAEGTGNVMSSWKASTPSQPKESQRSFIKTNQLALHQGCITAKSQREYAQQNRDIRFKQPSGKTGAHQSVPFKGPYGLETKRQDETIRNLMEASYTEYQDEKIDYPDLTCLEQKRRLKEPKHTKASAGHDIRTKPIEEPHEPFKMKRFANIPAKVQFQ